MVGKRVVVKLGGSVLSSPEDFMRAAEVTKRDFEAGNEILLVVSAMKGQTDQLIDMARKVGASGELLDAIAGLGEVLSARLMASALNSIGVPSVAIDPCSPIWPIYTDGSFGDADPDIPTTCGAAISNIEHMLGKCVPVVCGYVGKTREGKLTTLGRGGSDTTAVILARCLRADEVVLVKDSGGIMSADPKIAGNAHKLSNLSAEEALTLSMGGAKVLHHKAVRYLSPTVRMRVLSIDGGSFVRGGTIISGHIPELKVEVHEKPVSMVTLIVDGDLNGLDLRPLSESKLDKAVILYLDEPPEEVVKKVHPLVERGVVKAISVKKDLAMIKVWGGAIEDVPGVINKISDPLASMGINIHGLQTVHNKIAVFVDWKNREVAASELEEALG
ncbi:aspartate kinase [Candidatus Korarchaeum cryptofilum]|jgi:aspartate kinase|uniref:Aspartate kinase n=1 Tax=Candidatus Korarchaeum cryptofilum TaxID=498846 RepID=A0A429G683_9CREN|nr:aspartate kinase [Candidatus Korarchaeum cryptofilum]RSN69318.1 aspartate kinase [Candidatus Korarchaeum cryptofilum]